MLKTKAVLAVALVMVSIGCSSRRPGHAAPLVTPTTVSLASLRQQYFALVAPANNAIQNFKLPRSASPAGMAQLARPVISALNTLD